MTIKCKNMTHAMKAKKILAKNGIDAFVEKKSDIPDYTGCIYTINFDDSFYAKAIRVMDSGGVIIHSTEKIRYSRDDV